ncbi:GNAT family N-acetyltransferase [Streptomyces catenulae]|uniref:GNAT family N-acetyltransferase n=1 Tax=Streptomyces catenulae TaxID=66875 RepID=A0ABV2YXC0_9ACTN|nr:GNAT family N-acetyltransferase [Streptomyces catenulae]
MAPQSTESQLLEGNAVLALRPAHVTDHPTLVHCVRNWWGDSRTPEEARELSLLLPRLFLQFFSRTSLILEEPGRPGSPGDAGEAGGEGRVRAFLVGFHAPENESDAYIHFVGVHPALRGQGVGRQLYAAFFERAAAAGRTDVRAIVSPGNAASLAFHQAMGFVPEGDGDRVVDGLPVHADYDGPGEDRVCFRRRLGDH